MDSPTPIRRPEIVAPLNAGTAAVAAVGESMQRKPDRAEVWKITGVAAVTAAAVAVLISVPLALAGAKEQASQEMRQEARNQALEQAQHASADRADAAFQAAEEANAELARRGQPQVPVPRPSEDRGDQEGTLVAAAVAGTLAALPEQVRAPSAEDLGQAVAAYLVANPAPGPTAAQVADAVTAFVRANPPATGASGAPGVPGQPGATGATGAQGPKGDPGLTADEVRGAALEALAQNPGVLCTTTGGSWQRLEYVVVDEQPENPLNPQTTRTLWACAE